MVLVVAAANFLKEVIMSGKFFVIDGTDGSGKKTQLELLHQRFRHNHIPVMIVDFPQYDKVSSTLVKAYLNGEFGHADQVKPEIASIFFAIDRWTVADEIRSALAKGKVVLANRYVSSNKGHQAGKIKNKQKLNQFLTWVDNLEYEIFGIPRPDQIFLLYLPYKFGQKFVDQKGYRDYIGGKKRDIHEKDSQHLQDAEKAYLYVAHREKWEIIDCLDSKTGRPKSIQDINDILYQEMEKYFM